MQDGSSYFDGKMNKRDRIFFELGIKLATIYHQFSGSPIQNNAKAIHALEKGIEASIASQPFVTKVQIKIKHPKANVNQKKLDELSNSPFDYTELSGKNLDAQVELEYMHWHIIGNISWIPELNYPLMYVSKIEEIA